MKGLAANSYIDSDHNMNECQGGKNYYKGPTSVTLVGSI